MLPVRTDKNVDLGTLSIGEVKPDDLFIFAERNQSVPKVQSIRPMRRGEHALQLGTMNTKIGCAKSGAIYTAFGDRKCRDAAVVAPSTPNYFTRFGRNSSNGIKTPETLKFPRSICVQCDCRTNFSQLQRLLIDLHREPALAQCKSERQAANASADNANTNFARRHRSATTASTSTFIPGIASSLTPMSVLAGFDAPKNSWRTGLIFVRSATSVR